MRWSLRRAEPADVSAILAVVEAGFLTYASFAPAGWSPPGEDAAALERQLRDPASFTRVGEAGGRVVGVAHATPTPDRPSRDGWIPAVHVRYVFVLEPFWGTGLARELHARVVEHIAGRSARLYTPAGQARARRFYEREGWHLADQLPEPRLGFDIVEYRR